MQASSYESGQDEINVNEGSLNETANSVHFQNSEKDKEMASINKYLQLFIKEELQVSIKFDNLPQNKMISSKPLIVIEPIPWIYFLPHTILFKGKDTQVVQRLQDQIESLKRQDYSSSYDRDRKQLNIRVHNHSELCLYNIRCLKTSQNLHKDPRLLDGKYLVDKLYQFYEHFYQKIYFKETVILMLYWAHQKGILEHVITEQALKLVVICIFINFGYGVNNIVNVQSENKQKIKLFKKMNTFARMNARGQTQVMEELIQQFQCYTIQEKRGFYIVSKKKYQQIKDILPIYFPILPLEGREEEKYRLQTARNIKGVIEHEKENMSICKNLAKMFKFLHNKFEKPMRFVVDFQEKVAYRHEFSEVSELEVIHPVLNTSICKLKDSLIKNFKHQINIVFQDFNKNLDPALIIKNMLEKTRQ